MHFTSWERTDRDNPVLLAEDGPERLATFHAQSAEVGGEQWVLSETTATSATGAVYRLDGRLGRDKRLSATLDGREFTFINEASSDWVIVDAADAKVAQFSGKNSGVRRAILEFDTTPENAHLRPADVAALSWFTRLILEEKASGSAVAIISTLVLASLVAVVSFLF